VIRWQNQQQRVVVLHPAGSQQRRECDCRRRAPANLLEHDRSEINRSATRLLDHEVAVHGVRHDDRSLGERATHIPRADQRLLVETFRTDQRQKLFGHVAARQRP
jgi:hypothetical protein